jgi:hypothetical protein
MGRFRFVVHVAIGVCVGVVVALAASAWQARRERKASTARRHFDDSAAVTVSRSATNETAQAVLTLAGAVTQQMTKARSATPAPAQAAAPSQKERRSPQQHLDELRAMDQTLIERQKGEAYDREWAPATLSSIRAGLDLLKVGRRFTVEGAECRTFTCSANIRWENGADAIKELSPLVQYSYGLNSCTRGLTLPKTDFLQGEPVTAPLVFDCASRKNGPSEKVGRNVGPG